MGWALEPRGVTAGCEGWMTAGILQVWEPERMRVVHWEHSSTLSHQTGGSGSQGPEQQLVPSADPTALFAGAGRQPSQFPPLPWAGWVARWGLGLGTPRVAEPSHGGIKCGCLYVGLLPLHAHTARVLQRGASRRAALRAGWLRRQRESPGSC